MLVVFFQIIQLNVDDQHNVVRKIVKCNNFVEQHEVKIAERTLVELVVCQLRLFVA